MDGGIGIEKLDRPGALGPQPVCFIAREQGASDVLNRPHDRALFLRGVGRQNVDRALELALFGAVNHHLL